jgi:hypothetical protein
MVYVHIYVLIRYLLLFRMKIVILLVLLKISLGELAYVSEIFRHGARYTNHKFYDYNDTWQDEG